MKELFAVPIHRWSYSAPIDQFGAKPILKADADSAAPARALAEAETDARGRVENVKRLLVTAAPPLT